MSTVPPPIGEQVVAITGASSGVGRACAQAFGRRGARLALMARNEVGLRAAADEVRGAGGDALVLPLDVADGEAVEDAGRRIAGAYGRIDTWVNCAMVTVFAPALEVTQEEFRRVTEVSYLGYVHGTLAALRQMLPQDRGTIIQIGSALAYRSIPLQSAYCGAKAAIRGFTDSVRTELLHDGSHVRLSMLVLPAVDTPQFRVHRNKLARQAQPVPPIYAPEVIAEAVVWAAAEQPREMVIGESALRAVEGQKLAPGLLDRYLASTGYDAQQTKEPNDPGRPDNLFEPVPGDHGVHGPFTDRSRKWSPQLWARMHRRTIAVVLAGAGVVSAGIAERLRRG